MKSELELFQICEIELNLFLSLGMNQSGNDFFFFQHF